MEIESYITKLIIERSAGGVRPTQLYLSPGVYDSLYLCARLQYPDMPRDVRIKTFMGLWVMVVTDSPELVEVI